MVGWMRGDQRNKWMGGLVDRWKDEWTDGCVGGRMSGWVGGWMGNGDCRSFLSRGCHTTTRSIHITVRNRRTIHHAY